MNAKFYGRVIAGKLNLFKGEARLFKDCLASLEGKEVEISVGKRKHSRTEQQMRYYFGVVVKLIADYTGDDIDTIHEFCKDKFAPRKTITVQGEARTVLGCTHGNRTGCENLSLVVTSLSAVPCRHGNTGGIIIGPMGADPTRSAGLYSGA